MTYFGLCEKCGQPVLSGSGRKHREPAFPVRGWEVPRDQGGANHIRNRQRVPGVVRHIGCLPDLSVHENQESLV